MREHRLEVEIVHFPLHPETPEEGMTYEQLFAGRDFDIPAAKARFARLAAAEGLPLGEREMTFNSRNAQELAKWAETRAGGDAIHDALFRAYFVDGVNLARIDNLVPIAEGIGLSREEARRVLTDRLFRDAVDDDWRRSRELGITGVPTFVAQGRAVVGAQPYAVLERFVLEAEASSRG